VKRSVAAAPECYEVACLNMPISQFCSVWNFGKQ